MIHLGIHLTKVTAPYLIRKRGTFYLQKRVPKALVGHYGKELYFLLGHKVDAIREKTKDYWIKA